MTEGSSHTTSGLLNAAILLSCAAYLNGIGRLILDVRFVPEVFNGLPEDQPGMAAPAIGFFVAVFGIWLWALLQAASARPRVIALAVCNLLFSTIWGASTGLVICPTPCPVASPLTDIASWASVVLGTAAAAAIGCYLYAGSRSAEQQS